MKIISLACFIPLLAFTLTNPLCGEEATGIVFHDQNGNGIRDKGEPGIPGIAVSNQREVVTTDEEGRWRLPVTDDTIFFVVKPSGWQPPVNQYQLPQFYYIHKPKGSPKHFKYEGVEPTGPLPESIDFALTPVEEPSKFKAVFLADTQPATIEEVNFVADDVLAELIGTDATFGITLGDIMYDNLEFYEASNANTATVGIPWYNVVGNHDLNFEAESDADSDETFHRHFGPNYYSFNYGEVHFVVLDDVEWGRINAKGDKSFGASIDERQLEFVKNDLALVPDEKLVVLAMHIPITGVDNREELFRLLEQRSHILLVSAHYHKHAHQYLGEKDGWKGEKPLHHINHGAVSGPVWRGEKDEWGIPHVMMHDGTPNGYSIITFDGTEHLLDFKVARQSPEQQLHIYAPNEVDAAESSTEAVYVNVYNGSERSVVKMRIGESDQWIELAKVSEQDPYYVEARERFAATHPELEALLFKPARSQHLWKASLPKGMKVGSHIIHVEATDAYDRPWKGVKVIRVK